MSTPSRRSARPGRFPPGAVVTGGGRGLGRETARELHHRGWRVLLTDIDGGAARRTATALDLVDPGAVLDVTDAGACERLARDADERLGGLGLWVSNAGLLASGPVWDVPADHRRLLVDVNVHGVLNGMLAALGPMRERGSGHVVTVVSLTGLVPPPGEVVYAATKHAALAASLGTAADLRVAGHRGVQVSAVCPDGMWTPMLAERASDPGAAVSWSGSLLDPAYVARVVAEVAARPRPVTSLPRRRGLVARLAAAAPAALLALAPVYVRRARQRQLAWARRLLAAQESAAEGLRGPS